MVLVVVVDVVVVCGYIVHRMNRSGSSPLVHMQW